MTAEARPIPFAKRRWDHVADGISIGGHYYDPTQGMTERSLLPVIVGREFSLVVSLYSAPGFGPPKGVRHLVDQVMDGVLSDVELARLRKLGRQIADTTRTGRRVLVRCHAGYNRSALVAGYALLARGYTADRAVTLIRRARGQFALCNEYFVDYLKEGL